MILTQPCPPGPPARQLYCFPDPLTCGSSPQTQKLPSWTESFLPGGPEAAECKGRPQEGAGRPSAVRKPPAVGKGGGTNSGPTTQTSLGLPVAAPPTLDLGFGAMILHLPSTSCTFCLPLSPLPPMLSSLLNLHRLPLCPEHGPSKCVCGSLSCSLSHFSPSSLFLFLPPPFWCSGGPFGASPVSAYQLWGVGGPEEWPGAG